MHKFNNNSIIDLVCDFVCVFVRYRSNNVGGDEPLLNTFYLILDLMQFFDNYHAKRLDVALQASYEIITILVIYSPVP